MQLAIKGHGIGIKSRKEVKYLYIIETVVFFFFKKKKKREKKESKEKKRT
jgi:hypothetical protein